MQVSRVSGINDIYLALWRYELSEIIAGKEKEADKPHIAKILKVYQVSAGLISSDHRASFKP